MTKLKERKSKPISTTSLLILGLITLFGAFLRLYHLGYKPLWLDEAVIYLISNQNLKYVILKNSLRNSAPPLYVLLIHFILKIGDSEELLRSVSLIGGVASIPAMFFLSRQFIHKIPAYILCFIVAVAPTQVKYSQELREYSLTFLFSILILLFFYKTIKDPSWKNTAIMSLTMILGVFLQYGLSVLIISLNIVFLIELIRNSKNRRIRLLRWISSQVFVLLSAISVIQISLSGQAHFFENTRDTSYYLFSTYWNGDIGTLLTFTKNNTLDLFSFAFPGWIFFLTTIFGFGYLIHMKSDYHEAPLMIIIPLSLTYSLALLGFYPFHGGRQDIFLTPIIYLLFGVALNFFWNFDVIKRWIFLIIILIPTMWNSRLTWDYLNYSGDENIIPIIESLSKNVEEDDIIYVYYSAKPAFTYYYQKNVGNIFYGKYNRTQIQEYFNEIDSALLSGETVWLVFTHCFADECNLLPNYVAKTREVELIISDNNAYLYHAKP